MVVFKVTLGVGSSSSGPTASLLGTGVTSDLETLRFKDALNVGTRFGDALVGKSADLVALGVLEKNP